MPTNTNRLSVFAVCEKCKEKLYLQVVLEELKAKSKGGIFKVEVPHRGHSTIFFLTTAKGRIQVRGQVTGDSIVGAIVASSHQRIPKEKAKDIDTLLTNFIGIVPEITCVLVLDREGTNIGIKPAPDIPDDKIDMMEVMVYQIIDGIIRSFDLTSLGTGVFELGYFRFVFARAGSDLSLVAISNIRVPTEQTLAYSLLAAEKLWRIMDDRSVTLDIPILDIEELPPSIKPKADQIRYLEIKPGNYLAKLAIVGDEAVGKTSLVRRFVENAFNEDYKATLGVNIMTKIVRFPDQETTMKLSIHDMGGQEQFARVRKAYFRGTHACFITFDITNRKSFVNVKSWYEQTRKYAGESTAIILLGNKIDLGEKRDIKADDIETFVHELQCPYIETSAKTGENVEAAFSLISLFLCDRTEKRLKTGEQLPTLQEFTQRTIPREIIDALTKFEKHG
ncbi:MAG: Rab family GTPase [Candidatus Heimdallarchaeota archaeon]